MELARVAAVAADPDSPIAARIAALVTVVEAVSVEGAAIPDAIADAIDDLALVDGAVLARQGSAICAALHQLGARPDLETTRRRVVRRLIATGVKGLALAGLAIEIGDVAPGAALAVADYHDQIAPRVARGGDPIVDAWLAWLAAQPELAAAAVLRQLAVRGVALDAVFACATKPDRIARLRVLAPGILAR